MKSERSRKTLESQSCKNTLLGNFSPSQCQCEVDRHVESWVHLTISDSFSASGSCCGYITPSPFKHSHECINQSL